MLGSRVPSSAEARHARELGVPRLRGGQGRCHLLPETAPGPVQPRGPLVALLPSPVMGQAFQKTQPPARVGREAGGGKSRPGGAAGRGSDRMGGMGLEKPRAPEARAGHPLLCPWHGVLPKCPQHSAALAPAPGPGPRWPWQPYPWLETARRAGQGRVCVCVYVCGHLCRASARPQASSRGKSE